MRPSLLLLLACLLGTAGPFARAARDEARVDLRKGIDGPVRYIALKDEGQAFRNHYEATKFTAELLVRQAMNRDLPATIYRPGIVVGDSQTGETQKFDGPYFFASFLKRQGPVALVPRLADPDRVRVYLVPRDFVVAAMDAGEVAAGDPEVLAWSLMGIGELVGMRWILWNGAREMPEAVFDELARIIVRTLGATDLQP